MEFFKKTKEENADVELQQQVERGNLFVHNALSKHSERINEMESFLYAAIDLLTQKGYVQTEELTATVKRIREEMRANAEFSRVGISMRVDNPESAEFFPVNCEERLHICKAVCCKLDFSLSAEEIEDGKIKWDLGRPYAIRQEAKTCYCTHLNTTELKCSVYHQRPSVCKKYSCAKDERIWKNFEKMELNSEWIEQNIKERKMRFSGAPMFADEKINSSKDN